MSSMQHHAIVVTGFDWTKVTEAHAHADTCGLGDLATAIVEARANSYYSFAILPDGSREGWEASDRGDRQRAAFKDWLRSQYYGDGSTPLAWAEFQYDDDDHETRATDSSDDDYVSGQFNTEGE